MNGFFVLKQINRGNESLGSLELFSVDFEIVFWEQCKVQEEKFEFAWKMGWESGNEEII